VSEANFAKEIRNFLVHFFSFYDIIYFLYIFSFSARKLQCGSQTKKKEKKATV
jgi:hypothetical protein